MVLHFVGHVTHFALPWSIVGMYSCEVSNKDLSIKESFAALAAEVSLLVHVSDSNVSTQHRLLLLQFCDLVLEVIVFFLLINHAHF